jgi:hypothetical protein
MSAAPVHHVTVSTPTFHALRLVARIDRVSPNAVVEQVVFAYLETRLKAIHEAHHEEERAGRNGRLVDLAAWRTVQRSNRNPRSAGSRRRSFDQL